MQHLPKEIAQNVPKIYRDCLRVADMIGLKNGNREILRASVREQFKRNKHEKDPQKIEEYKEDAVRALSNYMFLEATRMAQAEREKAGGTRQSIFDDVDDDEGDEDDQQAEKAK
eukprot:jgi/Mesvir1/7491/Mv19251-RA.1